MSFFCPLLAFLLLQCTQTSSKRWLMHGILDYVQHIWVPLFSTQFMPRLKWVNRVVGVLAGLPNELDFNGPLPYKDTFLIKEL